jgi:hypothetical protein
MAKKATPAAKAAAAPSTSRRTTAKKTTSTSPTPTMTDADIRVRAYQRWEAAGCPNGDGVGFWLEAELELRQGV